MNKIRLSKSSISKDEKEAVLNVLTKEYLGMGEEVQLFENKIKSYLQTSMDVVCVSTGTAALHLALSALNLKEGDSRLQQNPFKRFCCRSVADFLKKLHRFQVDLECARSQSKSSGPPYACFQLAWPS